MSSTPRRRLRLDPRLVLGVVLVVASVGGVVALVTSLDRTTVVYTAAHALSVGERISTDDLVLADVRLGAAGDNYLRAEALPADGAVVIRPVSAGELVPRQSLGEPDDLDVTSVVVTSAGQLPEGVVPGARVDVWAATQESAGAYGAPRVIVVGAQVVRSIESSSFGGAGDTAVEIVVPRSDVAVVLDAVAGESAISLVPADRPLGGAR